MSSPRIHNPYTPYPPASHSNPMEPVYYSAHPQEPLYREVPPKSLLSQSLRLQFIRKVLGIVAVELLFTATLCFVATVDDGLRNWYAAHWWILILAAIVAITCAVAVGCYREIGRKVPLNYIMLAAFTVAEAIIV